MKPLFIALFTLVLTLIFGAASSRLPEKRITNDDEDSVKAYLKALPKLDLPFGDKEAFFYAYPQDWETDLVGDAWDDKDSTTSKYFRSLVESYRKLDKDSFFVFKTREFFVILASVYERNVGGNIFVLYTFTKSGERIDSLLLEGKGYIHSSQMHNASCYIDKSRIIHIKDFYIPSPAELVEYMGYRAYKISDNGVFVSYFEQKNGEIENAYNHHANNWLVFYERGVLKDHLKDGVWTEVKTNFNLKNEQDNLQFKTTHVEATYHNGLPVGVWNYYNVELIADDSTYLVHPVKGDILLMRTTYENGMLISRAFFNDSLKGD